MLSTQECIVNTIDLSDNNFNESTNDDKIMIEKCLNEVQLNGELPEKMDITQCNLTDDAFIPIASVLRFVTYIDLASNKLTSKSLFRIIKVGFL